MMLEELFSKVLREPVSTFSDHSSPETVRAWDSLRHIELVLAAEAEYGVKIAATEVSTLRTLGCMRRLLHRKGIAA
jgi:acyl carrier protein